MAETEEKMQESIIIDEELWFAAMISHRNDEMFGSTSKVNEPIFLSTRKVNEAITSFLPFSNICLPSNDLSQIDILHPRDDKIIRSLVVPKSSTFYEVRNEFYKIRFGEEAFANDFCDYEFTFAELCGRVKIDLQSSVDNYLQRNVDIKSTEVNCLRIRIALFVGYSGSVRKLVPIAVEKAAKDRFLSLFSDLVHGKDSNQVIILSIGAMAQQIVPNFAFEACLEGKDVTIFAINPGHYHYCLRNTIDGRSAENLTPSMLANFVVPVSRANELQSSSTIPAFRRYDSWIRPEDNEGSYLLDPIHSGNRGGSLVLHTFPFCWPGNPKDRYLDNELIDTTGRVLPQVLLDNAEKSRKNIFIPIFTTWSDEDQFHAAHLHRWMNQLEENQYDCVRPIIDSYLDGVIGLASSFFLCQNMFEAISFLDQPTHQELIQEFYARKWLTNLEEASFKEVFFSKESQTVIEKPESLIGSTKKKFCEKTNTANKKDNFKNKFQSILQSKSKKEKGIIKTEQSLENRTIDEFSQAAEGLVLKVMTISFFLSLFFMMLSVVSLTFSM